MSARRPFPLRTLMVCFTAWLIATEVLIFDQIKFDAKVELLEQAALRRLQVAFAVRTFGATNNY